jgi:acetyl esterase
MQDASLRCASAQCWGALRRRKPTRLHGFFTMVNVLPGSAAGLEYVGEQIDRHLAAQANPA